MMLLGTKTVWGSLSAIGVIEGERYYWFVNDDESVAMIPADAAEKMYNDSPPTRAAGLGADFGEDYDNTSTSSLAAKTRS